MAQTDGQTDKKIFFCDFSSNWDPNRRNMQKFLKKSNSTNYFEFFIIRPTQPKFRRNKIVFSKFSKILVLEAQEKKFVI